MLIVIAVLLVILIFLVFKGFYEMARNIEKSTLALGKQSAALVYLTQEINGRAGYQNNGVDNTNHWLQEVHDVLVTIKSFAAVQASVGTVTNVYNAVTRQPDPIEEAVALLLRVNELQETDTTTWEQWFSDANDWISFYASDFEVIDGVAVRTVREGVDEDADEAFTLSEADAAALDEQA